MGKILFEKEAVFEMFTRLVVRVLRPGLPGALVESVEHWARVWEIVGSNPGLVKPMTYKIDTCGFLARCLALLG